MASKILTAVVAIAHHIINNESKVYIRRGPTKIECINNPTYVIYHGGRGICND